MAIIFTGVNPPGGDGAVVDNGKVNVGGGNHAWGRENVRGSAGGGALSCSLSVS